MMTSLSTANKKRRRIEYEETDHPYNDFNNAVDIVSQGFDLVVSAFLRIQNSTQDELTRLAMERKQRVIERLNQLKKEAKKLAEEEMKKITDLVDESSSRSDEIRLPNLNEDILLNLFQFLPLVQILKLRVISKRMHQVVTMLISKRVKWNIYPSHYKLSLSFFSPTTPLHLHMNEKPTAGQMIDLKTNFHRFLFSSLMENRVGGMLDQLPEAECEDMTSIETFKVKKTEGKQTSIIINSSCNTLHTVSLSFVKIYPDIVQNDFNCLQHLTLECMYMKRKDNLCLLKKCAKSLTYLSLVNVILFDDQLDCNMEKLETLNIKQSPAVEAKFSALLSWCARTLKCLTLNYGFVSNGEFESLDVEMCSLEKIVISNTGNVNGLDNLLNRSPKLQHFEMEVENYHHNVDQMTLNQNTNVKRLILKNYSSSLKHQLITAFRDTLEFLDITFTFNNSKELFTLQWYLPKLKEIHVRGSYQKTFLRQDLIHHVPYHAVIRSH